MMAETEKILQKFRPNEPILFEEVLNVFPNHSRQWVYNTLKSLISSRRLVRFATGVYYIPKYEIFVNNRISVDKVAIKKYIQRDDDVYGYYSGMTLLYEMGIIKKKPQTITVVSNREKSRGRTITIHTQEIYVSKSPVYVTQTNHTVLQILEALRVTNKSDDETVFPIIYEYARVNRITISDVSRYCVYFPDAVSKQILSGKLLNLLMYNENQRFFR